MKTLTAQAVTFSIPPYAVYPVSGEGDYLYVIETTGSIEISATGAPYKPFAQGTREYFRQPFQRLEVHNLESYAVTVTLYAGYGEYSIDRVEVIQREWPTGLVCGAGTVPGNGHLDIEPPSGNEWGRMVKVAVTNLAPSLSVRIATPPATVAAPVGISIPPLDTYELQTSAAVRILNTSGTPVEIGWTQTVYRANPNA